MHTINKLKRISLRPISLVVLATLALIAIGVQLSTRNSKAAGDEMVEGVPQYQIFDIGVVQAGDTASQGFGVSVGGVAVGRSFRTGATQAFSWTQSGGRVALPNLAGRPFAVANSANDNGIVVGTGATTAFGSGRLPIIWQNGAVSQLTLPAGETQGDANDVNSAGTAVGSINAGIAQRAAIFTAGGATVITQTTSGGSFFTTAFGINDSGRIIGPGIDPGNAARNVGMVYDIGNATAFEIGALPGFNGAIPFGISNSGFVTGASMLNQGPSLPFRWSQSAGMIAVPLPTGTSQGSGRGVNSAGWVVGTASSAFAIPFLWNGITTYRLQDLIPANSGWDLSTNTSSSAFGISDNGVIVGTGIFNGATRAYAMVPVGVTPSPTSTPTATPTPTPVSSPTATPTASPTPATSVGFFATTYRQDESQSLSVTLIRNGVTTGGTDVIVTMSNTGVGIGHAVGGPNCGIAGVDYVNVPRIVTFGPGVNTVSGILIPLCPDITADANETFNLNIGFAPGTIGTGQAPGFGTSVVTINDTANQFRNAAPITIFGGTVANPYLSTITVSGATTNTFRIRVTLYDFYHDLPDNVDVLLVGPQGQKYVLMGDVGGPIPVPAPFPILHGTTITLADYPNAVLPDNGPLVTGIFRPTNCETPVSNFPAPAPAGPYVEPGCTLARANAQTLYGTFAGVNPNGVWSLYVRDDNGVARPIDEFSRPDVVRGEIQGGWGIELLPSTSSGIDISGRVLTPDGRGLRNATVTITDVHGNRRTATTGSFGYYRFFGVAAGPNVVMEVRSSRYRFNPRLVQVLDTITDMDFSGIE